MAIVIAETPTQIFFDSYGNALGQGGNGDGQIRVDTAILSETVAIPEGEMPADMCFEFKSTLNQQVTCTVQGCNSSDWSSTPVHNMPNAIVLADGSGTAQTDFGHGPDRFKYYRVSAVAAVAPASGVLEAWVTRFAQ